ncbi:MAG: NAD(P)H-dependent oxidoreductase, partial [Bacteroidota bacterium]
HPDPESYCQAISNAYRTGAQQTKLSVTLLNLHELQFNPILQFGYRKRTTLEPDLKKSWELIQVADHIVWVFPLWWGDRPALLKGFIDRLFLPGFAFRYREDSPFSDKLLKGKTARIIMTMDMPNWYFALRYGRPGLKAMRGVTLRYTGFKVKTTIFGQIRYRKPEQLKRFLQKVESMGQQGK